MCHSSAVAKRGMKLWLMKSEPDVYSIDDLERDGTEPWEGVRNYQARNFMRDMAEGDLALFYHSNAKPPGVAGVCRITREAYPDDAQFDRKSPYFDAKSKKEDPRWSRLALSKDRLAPRQTQSKFLSQRLIRHTPPLQCTLPPSRPPERYNVGFRRRRCRSTGSTYGKLRPS